MLLDHNRWEFLTEGGDISYRIYCKKRGDESSIIELMPLDRVERHLIMEEGQIICDQIGKCNQIFTFNFVFKSN